MSHKKLTVLMENKTLYRCIAILLGFVVAANFWVFARFTVDDAFITWRYGKNLINHGIWNYNPSSYDMTQAYTNPIYAFLSIIPAYFHIDTVFFFKIISICIVLLFCLWYIKKSKNGTIILLIALAFPQTMIHIFSGIETFLFVALLAILIISIYEEAHCRIIIASAFLFYTRPESLTLFLAIPLLYCNWQSLGYRSLCNINNYKPGIVLRFIKKFITIKSILVFSLLLILLLPNIIISVLNFRNILPNTFFVKNASFTFGSIKRLIFYSLTLLPLLMIFYRIPIRKLMPILVIFVPIIVQYSKTQFAMNYNLRSVYHILFPILFFVFSVKEKINEDCIFRFIDTETGLDISVRKITTHRIIIIVLLLLFFSRDSISGISGTASYYYRCLSAHAYSGKVINHIKDKYAIKSIACGDAGMLAFAADVDSLDLYELGSASLTHNGFEDTYPLYNPDVLFLYGNNDVVRTDGIFRKIQNILQYPYIGKVAWQKDYFLWVYASQELPELSEVFQKSYEANFKDGKEILLEHIFCPPWEQWHE